MIEGEFEMVIDGRRSTLGPGQTVHVPAGVVHAGTSVGATQGRRVLIFSPGGMEQFFLEVGASSADAHVDLAAAVAAAQRHGWQFVS